MNMSFRSARLALFLSTAFVTVAVAPSAAHAAKPSKAAKKLAKAAKKLLKKKDFDGAIAKYEEAYTESPAAKFQLGIAKALQKKGDNAQTKKQDSCKNSSSTAIDHHLAMQMQSQSPC